MPHQNALQAAQISKLEEQLAVMTKRKTRKRKQIQHSGTIEYGEAAAQVATATSVAAAEQRPEGEVLLAEWATLLYRAAWYAE
jgi:hypothetical protein